MRYREKLMRERPDLVVDSEHGSCGCEGCPGHYWNGAPTNKTCDVDTPCSACWDQIIPGTEEVESDQPKQSMDKETYWQYFEPVCGCKVTDIVKHINYCHHPDSLGPNMECNKHDCPFVKTIYPEPANQSIDVHKIIDDAMEKKDRSVMIFIGEGGTTISVSPLDDTKPRWIIKDGRFCCPECGDREMVWTPYCPLCGEKLGEPIYEDKEI